MKRTLYRSDDGELHETGQVDWQNGSVPTVCGSIANGPKDNLVPTTEDPTCEECQEIGPKWEWSE